MTAPRSCLNSSSMSEAAIRGAKRRREVALRRMHSFSSASGAIPPRRGSNLRLQLIASDRRPPTRLQRAGWRDRPKTVRANGYARREGGGETA